MATKSARRFSSSVQRRPLRRGIFSVAKYSGLMNYTKSLLMKLRLMAENLKVGGCAGSPEGLRWRYATGQNGDGDDAGNRGHALAQMFDVGDTRGLVLACPALERDADKADVVRIIAEFCRSNAEKPSDCSPCHAKQ